MHGDEMKEKLRVWFRKTKLYAWQKYALPKIRYVKYAKKLPLDDKAVFLESQHGKEMTGNIFHLLKELTTDPKYKAYNIYLSCRGGKLNRFSYILENNGMEKVQLVELSTDRYMRALASSKYLINDNTFLPFFIKRADQVYLNTWHGTPLKTLGKSIKNAMYGIGNAQKNFVTADYLLYPNRYTMNHMVEDYMLGNITDAKCVLSGYPRNSAFFREGLSQDVRKSMGIPEGMKIYAYMPTWRGSVDNIPDNASKELKHYLNEIDKVLRDDERLYLNLHPIAVKDVDVKGYKHIRNIPVRFDTYDFLTSTDCLITDYSSVFYDYAVSGKKIVLFTYDEEEYFADRGVYMTLSELPFPKVKTVEKLMEELRSPKAYDDVGFIDEYCHFDCKEASANILSLIIDGKASPKTEVVEMPCNGKDNVLLYADEFTSEAIEKAMKQDSNCYLCFLADDGKENTSTLAELPQGMSYFPVQINVSSDKAKAKMWKKLFSKKSFITAEKAKTAVSGAYGNARFSKAFDLKGNEINLSRFL